MTSIDEKICYLRHSPLFSGISKEGGKDLEYITVMVKIKLYKRILSAHQEKYAI